MKLHPALSALGQTDNRRMTDSDPKRTWRSPKPPYYAVIFTSINADVDHVEHTEMYHRMVELAATYDGFLGIEPARNTDGSGVAAIYWKDTNSIAAFSRDPEHLIAKKKGREIWYSHYMIRICKVEAEYGRSD